MQSIEMIPWGMACYAPTKGTRRTGHIVAAFAVVLGFTGCGGGGGGGSSGTDATAAALTTCDAGADPTVDAYAEIVVKPAAGNGYELALLRASDLSRTVVDSVDPTAGLTAPVRFGHRLLYFRGSDLYSAALDGTGAKLLRAGIGPFAITAMTDGCRRVYFPGTLASINADGTDPRDFAAEGISPACATRSVLQRAAGAILVCGTTAGGTPEVRMLAASTGRLLGSAPAPYANSIEASLDEASGRVVVVTGRGTLSGTRWSAALSTEGAPVVKITPDTGEYWFERFDAASGRALIYSFKRGPCPQIVCAHDEDLVIDTLYAVRVTGGSTRALNGGVVRGVLDGTLIATLNGTLIALDLKPDLAPVRTLAALPAGRDVARVVSGIDKVVLSTSSAATVTLDVVDVATATTTPLTSIPTSSSANAAEYAVIQGRSQTAVVVSQRTPGATPDLDAYQTRLADLTGGRAPMDLPGWSSVWLGNLSGAPLVLQKDRRSVGWISVDDWQFRQAATPFAQPCELLIVRNLPDAAGGVSSGFALVHCAISVASGQSTQAHLDLATGRWVTTGVPQFTADTRSITPLHVAP